MSSSILTNAAAMTALQVLRKTNSDLSATQNRISTGLKVGSAKENASFWAVAQVMRSDVGAFKAIGDNLALSQASTSVARVGAEKISNLVKEIKERVTAAQEGSLDKRKIQADIEAMLSQIGEISRSANFNGVNLLENNDTIRLLSSLSRAGDSVSASFIEFQGQALTLNPGGSLHGINGLTVLGRGDQLLEKQTDGIAKVVIPAVDSPGGDMAAGEKLTINYTDKNGVVRTFNHTLKQPITGDHAGRAKLVEELNGDAAFNKLFRISYDPSTTPGSFELSAADRSTNVTVNSWSAPGFDAKNWTSNYGNLTLTTNDAAANTNLTFGFTDWSGQSVNLAIGPLNFDTDGGGATNAGDARTAIETQLRAKLNELGYDGSKVSIGGAGNALEITSSIGPFGTVTSSVAPAAFDIADATLAGLNAVTATNTTQVSSYQFKDVPLRAGEDIAFNFVLNGVNKQVVLRVTGDNTASGIRLDNQANADRVILALDARKVSDASTTGNIIAAEIAQALSSLNGANAYGVDNSSDPNWNGLLVNGAGPTPGATMRYDINGSTLSLTMGQAGATANFRDSLLTAGLPDTDYQALLDSIEVALQSSIDAASSLGSAQARVDIQKDFIASMVDNLKLGIGTLVDADMTEESAKLQALQVQQQLGIQSLSIANQAPQMLLSLFK